MNDSSLEKWDRQIRLFAKYFLVHAALPKHSFTLLDGGCGTGSALHEIREVYPLAQLFGCDFLREHVDIAKKINSEYGEFICEDLQNINMFYDLIYISNVLEHISNWKEIANHLLLHCKRLYILVPYREVLKRSDKTDVMGVDHIARFNKNSFNYLGKDKVKIESRVIRTSKAWGHSLTKEITLVLKSFVRRKNVGIRRQILFAITNKVYEDILPPEAVFGRIRTLINLIRMKVNLL